MPNPILFVVKPPTGSLLNSTRELLTENIVLGIQKCLFVLSNNANISLNMIEEKCSLMPILNLHVGVDC